MVTGSFAYLVVATWPGACCVPKGSLLVTRWPNKLVTSRGAVYCVVLPCLSSMPGIVFARTFGPRSGRLWRPCLPVFGRLGSMPQMPRVEHVGAAELRAAGVTQWMLQRQAAVENGGDFLWKNLSALDDQP